MPDRHPLLALPPARRRPSGPGAPARRLRGALLLAALAAPGGLAPGPARAAPPEVPVLHLELTFHRTDKGRGTVPDDATRVDLSGSTATLREDVLLTVSLDLAPELRPVPGTLRSRYAWARELTHDGAEGRLREERGVESGTRLLDLEVRAQRSAPVPGCGGGWVYDRTDAERLQDERSTVVLSGLPPAARAAAEGARQARARAAHEARRAAFTGLRLHLRATWPGNVTLDDRASGIPPFDQELLPLLDETWTLPYGLDGAAARRLATSRKVPRVGSTPELEVLEEVEVSLAPIPPFEHGFDAGVEPGGALVARNRLVAGGRDVSAVLPLVRWARTWEVRARAGRPEAPALVRGWSELPGEAARAAAVPIAADALLPPPDLRPPGARRWLAEFLEMADGLPELGLSYRQVAIEQLPDGAYRVAASEARTVSPAAWCEIRGLALPATELPAVAKGGALRVLATATQPPPDGAR